MGFCWWVESCKFSITRRRGGEREEKVEGYIDISRGVLLKVGGKSKALVMN